jgi:hypothetical protein
MLPSSSLKTSSGSAAGKDVLPLHHNHKQTGGSHHQYLPKDHHVDIPPVNNNNNSTSGTVANYYINPVSHTSKYWAFLRASYYLLITGGEDDGSYSRRYRRLTHANSSPSQQNSKKKKEQIKEAKKESENDSLIQSMGPHNSLPLSVKNMESARRNLSNDTKSVWSVLYSSEDPDNLPRLLNIYKTHNEEFKKRHGMDMMFQRGVEGETVLHVALLGKLRKVLGWLLWIRDQGGKNHQAMEKLEWETCKGVEKSVKTGKAKGFKYIRQMGEYSSH